MSAEPCILKFPFVCENCGWQSLDKFTVPGITTMWHCSRCDLYQKGEATDVHVDYRMSYHKYYAAEKHRKLRTATIRLSQMASQLDVERPRLLDVGCSLGFTVESAARLGWESHGVDVSRDAIDFCRGRGLNCQVIDGLELPYDDNTFDALTAWHVIEHVTDVAAAAREWRRVLRPGGVFALETPDASCVKVRLSGARYRRFWKPEHVYVFRPENLAPLLEKAGFEILSPPHIHHIERLGLSLATYGVSYQVFQKFMSLTTLTKAFQLFCRRRPVVSQVLPLRRAA